VALVGGDAAVTPKLEAVFIRNVGAGLSNNTE
jgi:hypothetical protein